MTPFIATLLIASALTPTTDQAKTIVRLEDKLMAPCCYSQTIRVHMSTEAEQMREEVTEMVLAGKSEQDIIKYYKAKYGETILVVPDGKAGQIAYGVPLIVSLSAFGLLAFGIRRTLHMQSVETTTLQPNLVGSAPSGVLERIRQEVSEGFQ
jgi:cytochrome c-type biogenesis protein CcmH